VRRLYITLESNFSLRICFLSRFAPEMKALLYYNHDKKQRKRWVDQYRHEPKTIEAKKAFPIFVTSYEIAINDSKMLGSMRWKFIVVDEGHRLKNKNAR
jgi:ATP-dependent DNA helicase